MLSSFGHLNKLAPVIIQANVINNHHASYILNYRQTRALFNDIIDTTQSQIHYTYYDDKKANNLGLLSHHINNNFYHHHHQQQHHRHHYNSIQLTRSQPNYLKFQLNKSSTNVNNLLATDSSSSRDNSQKRLSEKKKQMAKFNNCHKDRDNHENNSSSSFYPFKGHFVNLLAALGLFKRFNSDDIEEERSKLSDEQKMRKMKPSEILIAKGVLAMCDQDYSNADQFFHKALKISQEEKNEEQEMLILNLLASNFFESGDLENAEKLFIDIMKRLIAQDVETTDPAILELSLKLASIYSGNRATHEKAVKGFKFVINSLLFKLQDVINGLSDLDMNELPNDKKDQLALLGWSYDWFAKHLLLVNDYYRATEMLKKALEISTKVLGPLHDQTLILLNDVGTTMAMNDDPEEGLEFLQKAVEGAIESQSRELASFYVNFGLVYLKLKKLQEAKRYCEYAIEMAMKNKDHLNSEEILKLSKNCLSEINKLIQLVN